MLIKESLKRFLLFAWVYQTLKKPQEFEGIIPYHMEDGLEGFSHSKYFQRVGILNFTCKPLQSWWQGFERNMGTIQNMEKEAKEAS